MKTKTGKLPDSFGHSKVDGFISRLTKQQLADQAAQIKRWQAGEKPYYTIKNK